ncbi:hypothetical protein BD779DRAFT_1670895 [Infundibulicybe gibba]|nr:hypothetical protein BD779DRAFT_1670895 [Infundibulicybe gibba]
MASTLRSLLRAEAARTPMTWKKTGLLILFPLGGGRYPLLGSNGRAEEEDLSHLAESLQAGFEHRGWQLKKEIADTFVPTVNRVKKLYCVIDDKVDLSFGQGLVMYNTACKDAEAASEQDQDDFQRTYNHHRDKIKDLFAKLEDAYAAHARLGPEFDAALCAIIDPALDVLENAPQKWEQTIAHLEKRSNLLEKTDSELAEKKMKGLLSKLV